MSHAVKIKGYVKEFGDAGTMKNLFFIALTIIGLSLLWKGFRAITKALQDPFNDQKDKDEAAQITKDVEKSVKVDYSKLPKSKSYYKLIADQLEKAMQGWGTSWSTIVSVTEKLSGKELEAVYQQFGGRVNEDFGNEAFDLFGWFKDEYSMFSTPCLLAWPKIRAIWAKTNLNNKP